MPRGCGRNLCESHDDPFEQPCLIAWDGSLTGWDISLDGSSPLRPSGCSASCSPGFPSFTVRLIVVASPSLRTCIPVPKRRSDSHPQRCIMSPEQPNPSAERTCAEIARLHALNEREAELACALASMFDDPGEDARLGVCAQPAGHADGASLCSGGTDRSFGLPERARGSETIELSPCPTLLDSDIGRQAIHASRVRGEVRPHGR